MVDVKHRDNQVSLEELAIGDDPRSRLNKLKSPELRKSQLIGFKLFYIKVTEHLQKKLALNNKIWKAANVLNPVHHRDDDSCDRIKTLALELYLIVIEKILPTSGNSFC